MTTDVTRLHAHEMGALLRAGSIGAAAGQTEDLLRNSELLAQYGSAL